MVILSSDKSRKAFYEEQAKELRQRAIKTRSELKDEIEAQRLEKLAGEAEQQAAGIQEQLDELTK